MKQCEVCEVFEVLSSICYITVVALMLLSILQGFQMSFITNVQRDIGNHPKIAYWFIILILFIFGNTLRWGKKQ